jgi:hypothetical protein
LYTFSAFSTLKDRYFFAALNGNYTDIDFATAVPPPLQLLLEDAGTTNQAAALDAVLMMRDPFPVVNLANTYPDFPPTGYTRSGTCTIEVRVHGQPSNTGTIRIRI